MAKYEDQGFFEKLADTYNIARSFVQRTVASVALISSYCSGDNLQGRVRREEAEMSAAIKQGENALERIAETQRSLMDHVDELSEYQRH